VLPVSVESAPGTGGKPEQDGWLTGGSLAMAFGQVKSSPLAELCHVARGYAGERAKRILE